MITAKSILPALVLIIVFAISFAFTFYEDEASLCKNDLDCISNLIKQTRDFDLCETTDQVEKCYERHSTEQGNEFLCPKTSMPQNCYLSNAVLYNHPELCDNNQLRDNCIFQVAFKFKDSSVCERADDVGLCYYSFAVGVLDESICDLSEKYKSTCVGRIVEAKNSEK